MYGNLGDDTLFGGQGGDVLFGGQGGDLLIGNLGDDTLNGNLGNDTISGGDGADLVVVQSSGGIDVMTDFDGAAGDRVQIEANVNASGIDTYAEVVAASTNTADGVQIALGSGNTLTLNGITVSQLQADWFTFG
jgi:Ca2+-binding RTX toxin-like protein